MRGKATDELIAASAVCAAVRLPRTWSRASAGAACPVSSALAMTPMAPSAPETESVTVWIPVEAAVSLLDGRNTLNQHGRKQMVQWDALRYLSRQRLEGALEGREPGYDAQAVEVASEVTDLAGDDLASWG